MVGIKSIEVPVVSVTLADWAEQHPHHTVTRRTTRGLDRRYAGAGDSGVEQANVNGRQQRNQLMLHELIKAAVGVTTADYAIAETGTLALISGGERPMQNGFIERFNRSYREAVLEMYVFQSLQEVREQTEKWLREYNEERPHESLGHLTPREYLLTQITLHETRIVMVSEISRGRFLYLSPLCLNKLAE